MPIDPSIVSGLAPAAANLAQIGTFAQQQTAMEARRKREDEQRKQQQIQSILQTSPDDETAVQRLNALDIELGSKYRTQLDDHRKKVGDALKLDLDNDQAQTKLLTAVAQGITDSSTLETGRKLFSTFGDEGAKLASMLPAQWDDAQSPAQMKQFVEMGLSAADFTKKQQEALDRALKGDWDHGLAEMLATADTPEEAQGALEGFKAMRAPKLTLDRFAPLVANWGPEAQKKAGEMALTEQQRQTLAGQAATRDASAANTAADNARADQQLAISRGQLDVARGNLAIRGREVATSGASADAQTSTMNPEGPHGDDYLKTLPPGEASMTKALAEGRMPWPTGTALRSPEWSKRIGQVFNYDPTFDAAQANSNARMKVRADFTSGKSATTINALNTVVGHLGTMADKMQALKNTDWQSLNWVKNWLKTEFGNSSVTNFDTAKEAVASELVRAWRGAGGAEQDIQDWKKRISSSASPEQLRDALSTIGYLLESKLDSMQTQLEQGMGIGAVSVITPEARAALDKLKGGGGAAGPKEGDKMGIKGGGTAQFTNGKWVRIN